MPKRKKSSGTRRQDSYSRRARSEGFAARSVYKLDELQSRLSLVHPGNAVLDLGAAPGSWSARLLELVGTRGRVVSVDLSPIEAIERSGNAAIVIQGDFTEADTIGRVAALGPFDVIVSDAAPSTTGNRTIDTARSAGLVESALALCESFLRPGGNAAFKLFQGGDEQTLLAG
ncbi:MAG: SAM-dependent methyltransferase, partial [Spirochaetia bacterium]